MLAWQGVAWQGGISGTMEIRGAICNSCPEPGLRSEGVCLQEGAPLDTSCSYAPGRGLRLSLGSSKPLDPHAT